MDIKELRHVRDETEAKLHNEGLTSKWRRAYERLADAADHVVLMHERTLTTDPDD